MLTLTKFISKGATRICFEHPVDAMKCVKVAIRFSDSYLLEKEIKTYLSIRYYVGEYLPKYDLTLVDTTCGKGIVCQLLRDDNGEYSKSLEYYIRKKQITENLKIQILGFTYNLVEHDIFFYDFNLRNFVVQIKRGESRLYYIDLKSFDSYKPWTFLHLEKISNTIARRIMAHRLKRLLMMIGIID